jgi:GGDEF domain-containing protein
MANNAFYKRMWDEVLHKGFWEGDIWNLVLSGEIRSHHLNISTVRDESLEPQYYVGMLQAVHFMAQHDSLTGLANRSMLMEQLEQKSLRRTLQSIQDVHQLQQLYQLQHQ